MIRGKEIRRAARDRIVQQRSGAQVRDAVFLRKENLRDRLPRVR